MECRGKSLKGLQLRRVKVRRRASEEGEGGAGPPGEGPQLSPPLPLAGSPSPLSRTQLQAPAMLPRPGALQVSGHKAGGEPGPGKGDLAPALSGEGEELL